MLYNLKKLNEDINLESARNPAVAILTALQLLMAIAERLELVAEIQEGNGK